MSGQTLREVLAEVAREHREDDAYPGTCICEPSFGPGPHYVAHLADAQARAVSAWLGEQREAVALGIAGSQKPCRKAIEANGGCISRRSGFANESCYCLTETDAALAAIREQIGGEVARGEAGTGPGATGEGSAALGVTDEAAGPSDRRICEREDEE